MGGGRIGLRSYLCSCVRIFEGPLCVSNVNFSIQITWLILHNIAPIRLHTFQEIFHGDLACRNLLINKDHRVRTNENDEIIGSLRPHHVRVRDVNVLHFSHVLF